MATIVFVTHLLFAIALFCVSVCATYLVLRLGIMDRPNDRSSHSLPTPSTGGIGIFISFSVGFIVICVVSEEARLSTFHILGFAVAACAIAFVGFLDDLGLFGSFKIKLAGQIGAAVLLLFFGIVLRKMSIPFVGQIELGWVGYPLTIIWIVALTNIFNFMDGLNGMAGGTAVAVAAFLCAITFIEGSYFVYIFCYVMAASAAGFLVFNFPRARLFMGDVGSQFIGFTFAALAVIAAEIDASRTSFLIVPLLFFNFIFDTVFTFCRRAVCGEELTQAHRTHLYQLLNQLGWSHPKVSMLHYTMTATQGVAALLMIEIGMDQRIFVFVPFLLFQIIYATTVIILARGRGLRV